MCEEYRENINEKKGKTHKRHHKELPAKRWDLCFLRVENLIPLPHTGQGGFRSWREWVQPDEEIEETAEMRSTEKNYRYLKDYSVLGFCRILKLQGNCLNSAQTQGFELKLCRKQS